MVWIKEFYLFGGYYLREDKMQIRTIDTRAIQKVLGLTKQEEPEMNIFEVAVYHHFT